MSSIYDENNSTAANFYFLHNFTSIRNIFETSKSKMIKIQVYTITQQRNSLETTLILKSNQMLFLIPTHTVCEASTVCLFTLR